MGALPVGMPCRGQQNNLEPNPACRDGSSEIYSFCAGNGTCSKNRTEKCQIDNDFCFFDSAKGEGFCEGDGICAELPCVVDCFVACSLAPGNMVPVAHLSDGKPVPGTGVICQNEFDFRT